MEIERPATRDMRDSGTAMKRAVQGRTLITRRKIAEGAIKVLASHGVPGLTHRAVAHAGGVSLAATTYHFATKQDILAETSRTLMEGYLDAFRRLRQRLLANEETAIRSLDDLVARVVATALGRERTRSLAWCELMLHGGRHDEGRAMARRWYSELDAIWAGIAEAFPGSSPLRAAAAIDITVGFTVLLHPLMLDQETVFDLLCGRVGVDQLPGIKALAETSVPRAPSPEALRPRQMETRERLIEATIDMLVAEGAAAVSHASIAERAGMVRSGPSYYFPTIGSLLEAAQTTMFERAKARYRAGIEAVAVADMDRDRLVDLTTTIFFREVLEFARENVGYYSVWMSAVQDAELRGAVSSALLDQQNAWRRRLVVCAAVAGSPLQLQALFVGKLIRGIVSQLDTTDLSHSREDFAVAIGKSSAGSGE